MPTAPDLDTYEIAYLTGGVQRVVDTALVAMVETGRIRVSAPGLLVAVDAVRRHPVEAAVLDAVGTRGHRSVDVILWRLADDHRLTSIGGRLMQRGLVSHWTRLLRRREGPPLLTTAGRRALHADGLADPALDGGSALHFARTGRTEGTAASIFEPLTPPRTAKKRSAEMRRRMDASRPGAFYARESPGGPVG